MPIDVPLDAGGLGDLGRVAGEGGDFGGIATGLAAVGDLAGVRGGAALKVPFVGPVAVGVGADAVGAVADLAVLSPEAVVGDGVGET